MQLPPKTGIISIIIPTLNEEENLNGVLAGLSRVPELEIIVADGGSRDRTVEIAAAARVRVIGSKPGRAAQMNAGAAMASGEIFLFLHGDTVLPEHFAPLVRQTLAQPNVAAGAFRLSIAAPGYGLRLIEKGVHLRATLLQMPYGDQAIFLRAETFKSLGGYPDMPIMEDFALVRKLRQHGRVQTLKTPVISSGRRWLRLGLIRTTLINQVVIFGYLLGLPLSLLTRWYYRLKK